MKPVLSMEELLDRKRRARGRKEALLARYARRLHCWYCGKFLGFPQVTAEHLVPISRGGDDHRANVVPACLPCNVLADTKTLCQKWALRQQRSGCDGPRRSSV